MKNVFFFLHCSQYLWIIFRWVAVVMPVALCEGRVLVATVSSLVASQWFSAGINLKQA